MKRTPRILKMALGISVALSSTCVWAQQLPSPTFQAPIFQAPIFQATDFGAIDASGLSAERFQGVVDTALNHPPLNQSSTVVATDNISIINNTLPTTKTKIFVWTDKRGVKHYSDNPAIAPKAAKTKVVITVQPPYTPPASLLYSAEDEEGKPSSSSETATPPVVVPPSQLPPIPPSL